MSPKSSWSFLVDENTSRTLVSALRMAGYTAMHVYDVGLQSHPDEDIYVYAQAHEQTINTGDLDFANITQYPPPHFGNIALRIPNSTPTADLVQEVQNALNALSGQDLTDALFILEPGRIRVRR